MTTKTVELAIFWMPLIGGVLLSGIAGSAWYGGDKIPAIWIAFAGAVLFLLTGAVQIQQAVYEKLLQPEIELIAPHDRMVVTWDPPESFFINARSENKEPYGVPRADSPVFEIKNASSTLGQDASITWSLDRFDMKAIADSSSRLSHHRMVIENQIVTIGPKLPITTPVGLPMQFTPTFKQSVPPIAFLGKHVDSWIPAEVWMQALLFFVATLPDEPGSKSPPLSFDVEVKWNIPENNKPAKFRVEAVAVNGNVAGVPKPALTAYVQLRLTNQ